MGMHKTAEIITWYEAPLYDLFVRPPSLMNFGGTWLSCKEKSKKISLFCLRFYIISKFTASPANNEQAIISTIQGLGQKLEKCKCSKLGDSIPTFHLALVWGKCSCIMGKKNIIIVGM